MCVSEARRRLTGEITAGAGAVTDYGPLGHDWESVILPSPRRPGSAAVDEAAGVSVKSATGWQHRGVHPHPRHESALRALVTDQDRRPRRHTGPMLRPLLGALGCMGVLVVGCSPGSSEALAPHYPRGISNCDGYALTAATTSGTVPLTSCAGVNLLVTPTVTLHIGDQVRLSGQNKITLTVAPHGVLKGGPLFTATHSGAVLVTEHGGYCRSASRSCLVVRIVVDPAAD
jgi:hypothetical protein